ncbi:hypothetical protein [Nonomuraea dietziae]|uniref:hypothetical protein n=1 Tax=Nonomuraea dietziae TaxID=65515 RepID=UPI0031D7CB5B
MGEKERRKDEGRRQQDLELQLEQERQQRAREAAAAQQAAEPRSLAGHPVAGQHGRAAGVPSASMMDGYLRRDSGGW